MSKNRDLGNYGSAALLDASSNTVANTVVQRTADGSINANNVTASTFTGALSGTATSLATARTITLAGDLSGSASFDGSANVTITATVADDSHNHIIGNVDGLQDALDLKAPLASPTLTGVPAAPTANAGTNTTQIATTAFVQTAVSGLVDAAPTTLDTLNELAAALGDDPNFATTVSNSIGGKAPLTGEGTSGTWGISITGNANTVTNGVYTSGNQTIGGVKTFSNNAVFDGNVGVGTNSPNGALDVLGRFHVQSNDGVADIFVNGTSNRDALIRFREGTTQRSYIQSTAGSNNLIFGIGTTEHVRITPEGNLGIGTSSPIGKLTVSYSTYNSLPNIDYIGPVIQRAGATSDAFGAGLAMIAFQNKGGMLTAGGYGIDLLTYDGDQASSRIRIANSGNVGIGTTTPIGKCTSSEGFTATGIEVPSDTNVDSIQIGHDGTDGLVRTWNATGLKLSSYEPIKFEVLTAERMRIASAGIGIGTTNPNRQLTFGSKNEDAVQIRRLTTSQGAPATGTGISWTWTSAETDNETWAAIRVIMPGTGSSDMTFSTTPINGGGAGLAERMRITHSGHVLPGTNATQDLGSSTLRWNTVYTSDLSLKNDHGDWTIVEGEDDLFLYNNKKGKVYKFALTEVDPSIAPAKRD